MRLPRFARGKFSFKNPGKYIGSRTPTYRSSWEQAFMRLCDEHPNVYQWASESIKIPYRHPFTGKYTVYVPDFFIVYQDKEGRKHAEMVEVKPMSVSLKTKRGGLSLKVQPNDLQNVLSIPNGSYTYYSRRYKKDVTINWLDWFLTKAAMPSILSLSHFQGFAFICFVRQLLI